MEDMTCLAAEKENEEKFPRIKEKKGAEETDTRRNKGSSIIAELRGTVR